MCRLISAAERANTSSRSSDALTSSPISESVARTSAEVSVAAFSASVPVCDSRGFIEAVIIAGEMDVQDARLDYVENHFGMHFCRIFSGFMATAAPSIRLRAGSEGKHGDLGHISIPFGV